ASSRGCQSEMTVVRSLAGRLVTVTVLLMPSVPSYTVARNFSPVACPYPRAQASMAYDPIRKQVVLFGGTSDAGFLNDTWVWDGAQWSQMDPPIAPKARFGAAMVFDAATRLTTMFGGSPAPNSTVVWKGTAWR